MYFICKTVYNINIVAFVPDLQSKLLIIEWVSLPYLTWFKPCGSLLFTGGQMSYLLFLFRVYKAILPANHKSGEFLDA